MLFKKLTKTFLFMALTFGMVNAQDPKTDIKKVATQFVQGADDQDAELLKRVLEPNSIQYALIGGKFNTFSAEQYIKMVADKKLGGKPRKITFKHAELLSNNMAVVVINAVSSEHDFLYHLSLARSANGKWEIVGITAEIDKV